MNTRTRTLRERQGRSYARVAARETLRILTGLSMTSVHLRAHGDRRFDLAELELLARSADPKVNAMHPIAEGLAVIGGARCTLDVSDLAVSLLARSIEEQRSDGAEDVTQLELHAVLEALRSKGLAGLSYRERERLRLTVARHRDATVLHCANAIAVAADCEALLDRVEVSH